MSELDHQILDHSGKQEQRTPLVLWLGLGWTILIVILHILLSVSQVYLLVNTGNYTLLILTAFFALVGLIGVFGFFAKRSFGWIGMQFTLLSHGVMLLMYSVLGYWITL
ncbi:MAG: hypothetical protein HKN32_06060, partial [Flavobacteriales bacterium]|nr:hypothetical protein [Flavobacteriales bacterium]